MRVTAGLYLFISVDDVEKAILLAEVSPEASGQIFDLKRECDRLPLVLPKFTQDVDSFTISML